MRRVMTLVVLLSVALAAVAQADGGLDEAVARDESLALKNSVRAVLAALGTPPEGYAQSKEDFDLPTSMGVDNDKKGYWLNETGGTWEFTAGKSGEQIGQEYQKAIMAAQAKGDYQEMNRLAAELQQNMMGAMNAEASKITLHVWLNRNPYQTIDPEGVVWETPGAIAIRTENNDPGAATILAAFDPRTLADTKKVSVISMGDSFSEPSPTKTAVRTVVVEWRGPEAAVTAWAKAVDPAKVLAVIKP